MNENEKNAKILCDAIREMANHPETIENFECYLSRHFTVWMERWANSPEGLAREASHFANIY